MKKLKNDISSLPFGRRVLTCLVILICSASINAKVNVVFKSSTLPDKYDISESGIFYNSDTVFVNDQFMIRGDDYTFDSKLNQFDFSMLNHSAGDSISVSYHPIPDWIKPKYGREIPEITSDHSKPIPIVPSKDLDYSDKKNISSVKLSGVKTFRFSNQSSGGSEFNQSLDMKLSGKLTQSLTLEGNISDRGYDPVYGTVNSRLNELDKINVKLYSDNFQLRLGDILVANNSTYSTLNKKISGLDLEIKNKNWQIDGTAARSKGRFETATFFGVDNRQGPYRLNDQFQTGPVVPASETVWLDGQKLVRGADKDYTMDYPAGTITFNSHLPIDRRNRIEIDYEPLLTLYKGEYFKANSRFAFSDSTVLLSFGWLREGDDSNELISDLYNQTDKDLLAAAGDVNSLIKNSVTTDSLGSYILLADSLPDTVYQFIGDSAGVYNIRFSYVGENKGSYNFAGGEEYYFVGDNNGSYLPVIYLTPPKRSDYLNSEFSYDNRLLGKFEASFLRNQYDANLYSNIDDDNNGTDFYRIGYSKSFDKNKNNSLAFRYSNKDESFQSRQRLFNSDLSRKFMIPQQLGSLSEVSLIEFESITSPFKSITLSPKYYRYKSSDDFTTNRFDFNLSFIPSEKIKLSLNSSKIESDYLMNLSGDGDNYSITLYTKPSEEITFESKYENDDRKNNYNLSENQSKYQKASASVKHDLLSFSYEYYREDSTVDNNVNETDRNRLTLNSHRKLGRFSYNLVLTYQNLKINSLSSRSILSRVNLQYYNSKKKFNWSTDYSLSDETRRSRGIHYLEVNPGDGDYILEDGQYLSDPSGNYIRLEEILSEQSRVERGIKSFQLNKSWSKARFRFSSDIEEELLQGGKRSYLWLLPFYSDGSQPYFFYNRRYQSDLRLLPLEGGYAVSFVFDYYQESRTITSVVRTREEWQGETILNQRAGRFSFVEKFRYFNKNRDQYYNGGGSGKIKGLSFETTAHYLINGSDLSVGSLYRTADDDLGGNSDIYAVTFGNRLPMLQKGEFTTTLELYRQDLNVESSANSFLLTDNRSGEKGVNWSTRFIYSLRKGLKFNINFRGRHADDRTARITGRGELVASF